MKTDNKLFEEIESDIKKNKDVSKFIKIQKSIYSKIPKCKPTVNISKYFKSEIKQLDMLGVLKNINAEVFIRTAINSNFGKENISDKLKGIYKEKQTKLETDLLRDREKLIQDRISIYENLIKKNKRIIKLTNDNKEKSRLKIENEKINNNLYSYKYADVYNYVNECRLNGKTVDNALKEGIDIYKDKNIHIQKLIDNHGNMEDVINYLHNSYYKTPFKNINKLFSGIHSTNN